MYLGYQQGKIKFYTEEPLNAEEYNLDKTEETDQEYVIDGDEYVLKDQEWEEEQARKERERINMLSLTRGDVFRGLLQAKGVTKAQLRAGIEAMPEGLQKEMALIDFDEALNFFRGNPLVDTVGATLGITSEQLDRFFETNDYHELISEEPEPGPTPEPEPEPEINSEQTGSTQEGEENPQEDNSIQGEETLENTPDLLTENEDLNNSEGE